MESLSTWRKKYVSLKLIIFLFMFIIHGFDGSNQLTAEEILSDGGNYYPMLKDYANRSSLSLSYLSRNWPDIEQWRIRGRAKMHELLSYETDATPLDEEILDTVKHEGYTQYLVRYSITPNRKTEAFLLIPDGLKEPVPAVLALHDHGAFYYFGKEKHTSIENPPEVLKKHIDQSYGGRTYAEVLVRRGFVVLCPDAFYFGSQRIDPDMVSSRFIDQYQGINSEDENESIQAFNMLARNHETLTAKMIFTSGTTWPGILFHGDRRSVDYLLTRSEVDPNQIGCIGLSIGGFRSAHLFGLDPRIKAGVVAGWMTTYDSLLFDHLRFHTWMIYIPGQYEFLDLPDVASLNAPNPLMIINCKKDALFTLDGMRAAEKKLATIYKKIGASDKFACNYYDVPHSLNVDMQNDAIDWLEKWLR